MELIYKLEPIEIYADQHLMEQVWDNLLTNAIRYSEVKGKIVVICTREGRCGCRIDTWIMASEFLRTH